MASTTMCLRLFRGFHSLKTITPGYSYFPCITRHSERHLFGTPSEESKDAKPSGTELGKEASALPELKELQIKVEELQSQYAIVEDKYKRALAETENVRTRLNRQIKDAKLFGIQGFCKDLLEVADVLNKATTSVPLEEVGESNPHLKSLFEGLKMTETQLQKVFRVHGLVQINPIGEKFDPNKHEAVFEQEIEGKPAGTVAVVTKVGYSLHDRTIRPAVVGVVKAKGS